MTKKRTSVKKTASLVFGGSKTVYAIVAIVLLSALAVGGIFAKYVKALQNDGQVTSPAFYFTSDELSQTPVTYVLNPTSENSTSFSFTVRNHADQLRYADKEITYRVSVTPSEGVKIKLGEMETSEGTLSGGRLSSERVTLSGLQNGVTYTVSVTGEAGFQTTLSATVTVKPSEAEIYRQVDDSDLNYVLLTVWTKDLSGDVSVSFPEGLIPDTTDPVMSAVNNYQDGAYKADRFIDTASFQKTYSSHVYRFFKTSAYNGETAVFTVTCQGKTAGDPPAAS